MWDQLIEAVGPVICFIVSMFALPLIMLRIITKYFDDHG
jgi:hypothetical protein